eukprot:7228022-Pyramimonas_sp.AAC.1
MFSKQYIVFHIIDRCIRWAAGQQVANKAMHTILDAYHLCWMQRLPATVMHSDGEGASGDDAPQAILKAKGAPLRIRARGQSATAIGARSG